MSGGLPRPPFSLQLSFPCHFLGPYGNWAFYLVLHILISWPSSRFECVEFGVEFVPFYGGYCQRPHSTYWNTNEPNITTYTEEQAPNLFHLALLKTKHELQALELKVGIIWLTRLYEHVPDSFHYHKLHVLLYPNTVVSGETELLLRILIEKVW